MKTLIRKLIPLLFIILGPGIVHAQITTTAGTVTSCPGEIVVPVNVTNCNGVGAISLMLNYSNTVLTYLGYQNLNSTLATGFLIVNSTGSTVIISWASTTVANIGAGTLMQLRFTAIPGSTSLNWDTGTPGNCEYSDANGNILPSTYVNGAATINQPPLINTQPTDMSVLEYQNASFTTGAIATGIQYQWYGSYNGGANWLELSNSSLYGGVTTASLTVYNTQLTYDGYLYRCEVGGTCSPPAVSDAAMLTIVEPLISSFDVQNVCPGTIAIPILTSNFNNVAAFSLTFSYNSSVLTYSGYQELNASLPPGNFVCNAADGKVYMSWSSTSPVTFILPDTALIKILFSGLTGSSNLTWDTETSGNCEYSDLNGNLITSVFVNGALTVFEIPTIVNQPVNKTIAKGQNTIFGITASGSGLTYLWQVSTNGGSSYSDLVNGGYYSNVTTPTMTITSAQLALSGYLYRCRVSGTCTPIAYSNGALLTVLPNIITVCQSVSGCPGQIIVPVNVTDFNGISAFSMVIGFNSSVLTYNGYQNLNTTLNGGYFSAGTAGGKVYITWSRTTAATITNGAVLLELKFNGVTGTSALTWDTQTPGNCEYSDVNGLIVFSTWTNGNVTVYQPPVITNNPADKTIYSGGSTTFSVTATGTGLGYQWQVSANGGANWSNLTNTSPYSGVTTATMTINPANLSLNAYLYRCYVTGTCTPYVYSGTASLTVTAAAITTSAGSISNSCSGNLTIPVNVSNCNNVGGISLALSYDPAKLTFDGYQSAHAELSTGLLIVNNTGTQIKLSWASTNPADIGSSTLIEYKFKGNAGQSTTLSWDTQIPGNCEYSDLGGTLITSFYVNGSISIAANALIANAGNDVIINPGGNTQLNGSATGGTTPYTYLWTPSTGLNNPSIANPVSTPASTITYTLSVTDNNSCSSSDQVTVTVAAPLISLSLKVMLEGPFFATEMNSLLNSSGNIPLQQPYGVSPWFYTGSELVAGIPNANVTDWVLVELRQTSGGASTATSGTRIALKAGFVLKNGNIVDLSGSGVLQVNANVTQNLFVVIWHRNHLGIMSANAVTQTGGIYTYDFTTSFTKAYGGPLAQKQLTTGIWGMVAGDGNGDKLVNTTDKTAVWGISVGRTGYLPADFDMNGQVNNVDKNDKWVINTSYQSQVPN